VKNPEIDRSLYTSRKAYRREAGFQKAEACRMSAPTPSAAASRKLPLRRKKNNNLTKWYEQQVVFSSRTWPQPSDMKEFHLEFLLMAQSLLNKRSSFTDKL
jgi:hypothetical protein